MTGGWQSSACVPLPADGTFKAYVHYCSIFTPQPAPSWWTLDHIGALCAAVALVAAFTGHWLATRHARPDEEPEGGTVTRTDRELWANARTLADLGELTAQWLEGRIDSQPGYYGPSDIGDPAMTLTLARLNRAGFVTDGSQPGGTGITCDAARWDQCAAVEGYASGEVLDRLRSAVGTAGWPLLIVHRASRWRYRYDRSVTVTTVGGEHYTAFGVRVPRYHIRDPHVGYGICHPDAVEVLCDAWQVTVIDPEWGREASPLWDVLDAALSRSEVPS